MFWSKVKKKKGDFQFISKKIQIGFVNTKKKKKIIFGFV